MAYARPGVYISERLLPATIPAGVTANAAGAVVAAFAQGPEAVTLVTSWYEFTKYFGGYNASYPATFQVGSFFQNGGRELYVKRILASNAVKADIDFVDSGSAAQVNVEAKNAGTDGNKLRAVLSAGQVSGTYTLTLYKESGVANDVTDDILLERYENIVFDDSTSSDYGPTVINIVSPNITVTVDSGYSGQSLTSATYPLTGGSNGTAVAATDYTNYKAGGASVFEGFSSFDRPMIVFLPDVNALASGVVSVFDAATSWAEDNNGFVVIDTDPNLTVANAISFAASLADTSNAAVYYPNVFVADPLGRGAGALRKVGPSGGVVGLYLATDAARGVFKAPAGIAANLQGIVAVEKSFTSSELDSMNASTSPVNPIRQIPGAGLAVMGARTLKQDGTANKYVNMRRSLIYIRKNLKNLTEFAIFENNDERLWAQIRTALGVFLNEYRNQGGLRGASPAQAFFIKCDAENNTAQQIANGEVHIQVGVALQYPAEFIVIDLSQKTLN
jgi:phage tail sheath protein FI